jgi:hypothetical protein
MRYVAHEIITRRVGAPSGATCPVTAEDLNAHDEKAGALLAAALSDDPVLLRVAAQAAPTT